MSLTTRSKASRTCRQCEARCRKARGYAASSHDVLRKLHPPGSEYEYAGFTFVVQPDGSLRAKEGQHEAAYKEKHRRAAEDCMTTNVKQKVLRRERRRQ